MVQVHARRNATRCAVCHDDLVAAESTCPLCGASFHFDCAAALGGCATLGCKHGVHRRQAASASLVPYRPAPRGRWIGIVILLGAVALAASMLRTPAGTFKEARTHGTLEALARYRHKGAPVSCGDYLLDAWGERIHFEEPDPRRGTGWVIWSTGGGELTGPEDGPLSVTELAFGPSRGAPHR